MSVDLEEWLPKEYPTIKEDMIAIQEKWDLNKKYLYILNINETPTKVETFLLIIHCRKNCG